MAAGTAEDVFGDQIIEKFMSGANKINYTNNKASDNVMDYDDDLAEEAEDTLAVALNVMDRITELRDKLKSSLNRPHQQLLYEVKINKCSRNFLKLPDEFSLQQYLTTPLMKRLVNDYMEPKFKKDVYESLCNNEKVATTAFSSNLLYDLKCDIIKSKNLWLFSI